MSQQSRYSARQKNNLQKYPIQRRKKDQKRKQEGSPPQINLLQRHEMGGGDRQMIPSQSSALVQSSTLANSGSILDRLLNKKEKKQSNQPIQRVPLGIYSDAPHNSAENQLDTDNMDAITNYIIANKENGRQDLNRLLVDTVRRKDRGNLYQVQTIVNQNSEDSTKQEVAKTIHLIWNGNKINGEAVSNIESIHASITGKEGWKIILWTDSRACGFLDSAADITQLAQDNDNFEIRKDLADEVDDRVKPTYEIALGKISDNPKGGYTMMSDLARYSILLKQGGIYMDVDLNLGDADVSSWDLNMSSEQGIPAFGPNIQYIGDMNMKLGIGLTEANMQGDLKAQQELHQDIEKGIKNAFEKMFKFQLEDENNFNIPQEKFKSAQEIDVFSSNEALSKKTRMAAMVRYMRGDLSNNLVAAPAGQKFMEFLIKRLSKKLADQGNDFAPGGVAQITGPSAMTEIIHDFYQEMALSGIEENQIDDATQNNAKQSAPSRSEQKRVLMDPNWISQLVQIEWLTMDQKVKYLDNERKLEELKQREEEEKAQAQSKKCCYITTACVDYMGLGDDCEELSILRQFRDHYLIQKTNGPHLLALYYQYSPQIVAAIKNREDEDEILERLYGIIKACVEAIKVGNYEFAFQTYCYMVVGLKDEFIPDCPVEIPSFAN